MSVGNKQQTGGGSNTSIIKSMPEMMARMGTTVYFNCIGPGPCWLLKWVEVETGL